jgi:hypothetical protein
MAYYAKSDTPISTVPGDLVIWGPGDPRPTLPIAGWNPGSGTWPQQPPSEPPPGTWGGSGERFPTVPIAEPPWGWGNPPPKPSVPDVPGWQRLDGLYLLFQLVRFQHHRRNNFVSRETVH